MWKLLTTLAILLFLSLPMASADSRHAKSSPKKARHSKVNHRARAQFTVHRYSRERDLWSPQIFSGLTAAQVKTKTKADDVFTLGFLDIRKARGGYTYRPINLHIVDGTVVVPAFFPKEKVLADFPWEGPTIYDSATQCLSYGTPTAACGLKRIPPDQTDRTGRRIWAIKGKNFFVVDYFGTRTDGLRIARSYGFESSAHSDGGHMVSPYARHASFALIFKGKRPLAIAGLFDPLALLAQ